MAKISKIFSGLLYIEDFSDGVSLLWDYAGDNATDRVVQKDDSISIIPKSKLFELFIKTPNKDGYVFQTNFKYNPSNENEKAGIILRSLTNNYAFIELNNDNVETYQCVKADISDSMTLNVKGYDGFYWENVGNTTINDANSIGYYIDATSEKDCFDIFNCAMYKSNFITINGIHKKHYIKIYDKNGTNITNDFFIRKKNTKVIIDGTNVIFPMDEIKISILDYDDKEILSFIANDVYGGDIFSVDSEFDVYLNGNALNSSTFDLGEVDEENIYRLTVTSNENFNTSVKIKIKCENSFNGGNIPVYISSISNVDYKKELEVDFKPYDSKDFYIKIINDNKAITFEDYFKFKIFIG